MGKAALTAEAVALRFAIDITAADDASMMAGAVSAVKAMFETLPVPMTPSPVIDTDPPADWTDATEYAAFILAARLFRRKGSPNGIEAFTESGTAYVSRYDPDVARLLQLNKPRVG